MNAARRREPAEDELDARVTCDVDKCFTVDTAAEIYCHGCGRYVCEWHRPIFGAHAFEAHTEHG